MELVSSISNFLRFLRHISGDFSSAEPTTSLGVPRDLDQFRCWGVVLWGSTVKNALEDLESGVPEMWLWLAC